MNQSDVNVKWGAMDYLSIFQHYCTECVQNLNSFCHCLIHAHFHFYNALTLSTLLII